MQHEANGSQYIFLYIVLAGRKENAILHLLKVYFFAGEGAGERFGKV